MAEIITNCRGCRTKSITFDVMGANHLFTKHDWQKWYEIFSVCRNCQRASIFVVCYKLHSNYKYVNKIGLLKLDKSLNNYFEIKGPVTTKDLGARKAPEHVPKNIKLAFEEGASCISIDCWNAAASMFRLCLDLATKSLLPEVDTEELTGKIRGKLGLRLNWLFKKTNRLPSDLEDLSRCIKDDGNDGVHDGNLKKEDAEDLMDFTTVLLERLYTEPQKIRSAEQRRTQRRSAGESSN